MMFVYLSVCVSVCVFVCVCDVACEHMRMCFHSQVIVEFPKDAAAAGDVVRQGWSVNSADSGMLGSGAPQQTYAGGVRVVPAFRIA